MNRADALRINISTWNAKAKRLRHEASQLDAAINQLEQDMKPMTLLPLPAADEAELRALAGWPFYGIEKDYVNWLLQLIADLREVAAGAEPRCPMCEGPVKFEEYGDCTMHIFCADSEPHWAKTLEDGLLPAIAAGNRVALRARQGTHDART